MARVRPAPVRVALIDDYDVVVIGLAHMFDPYQDRIVIAEIDTNMPTPAASKTIARGKRSRCGDTSASNAVTQTTTCVASEMLLG